MKVNHINLPDDKSNIFCKRINGIIHLDQSGKFWKTCRKCTMFNGSAQGEGVECLYDDPDTNQPVVINNNPKHKLMIMNH